MSSAGSVQVQITQVTVFDPLGLNGYNMLVVGGVYHAAPTAAVDGEAQSINVNELGLVRATGSVPDHAAIPATTDPIWVGGIYEAALPTYDTGDVAALHTDVNGRMLVREDTLDRNTGVRGADTLRVTIATDDFALGDGVTAANSLRVTLANDDFQQGAGVATASTWRVTIADDDFTFGNGIVDATTLRVSIATDNFTKGAGVVDATTLRVTMATDTISQIQGTAADNAAASGNPVWVGAEYNATPPTYDDNDLAALQSDINGRLLTNTRPENKAAQTVKSAQVAVGVAPAIRVTTDGAAVTAGRSLLEFMPDPDSAARFYYGPLGVLITTGKEVFAGQTIEKLNDENEYYIVSDTAGQTFHCVEVE